jgi:hypothetical protein
MSSNAYVELRLHYPGHPYAAILGSLDRRFGFERIIDPFYHRRDLLADGSWEQVHRLPCIDLTYEVEDVRDGKRTRSYVATLEGQTALFQITRAGAEAVAGGRISIRELARKMALNKESDL